MIKLVGRWVCVFLLLSGVFSRVEAEVMLQFFSLTWQELTEKMPEIAENGYTSLWLPPPQKASGDLSVGYDLWDPFDIGGNPQRTGGRTRWGTEEEMLRLIETAHRFGLRIYFDNIMNHRAFDIPGFNENTPIDLYPGMLPEDFHVQVTEEGFYRPWGNTENWGSTWEVQHRYLSGLIDIAHEVGGDGWNRNFGPNEGDSHPGIRFVRHPQNPEFYDYHPDHGHVGFGSDLITTNTLAEHPEFYEEDVNGYQMRSVRWLVDYTKLDGLRLDAVKHVPGYFYGKQDGTEEEKNHSTAGYIGQAQWQFNQTRGFVEENLRGSMWDLNLPRVSLMVFGEHMGEPPPYSDYWSAGMRLLDARTHSTLNRLQDIDLGLLQTSDYIEGFQMGKNLGVYYAKSHDDDVAWNEHLQYAINLTREGLPNIYTDGNRQAPTLGDSGGAFPRHANTRPFGQFGDTRVPNLVHIHNAFARGGQYGRWADNEVLAYERRDYRENGDMTQGDATTLFFMMNRDWDAGHYREIDTSFPDGSILWQYAHGGGQFYHEVTDGKIKVTVPPAGYFVFSWRSPEESDLWKWGGGRPIELYADGQKADTITYRRWDGPDGDREFNPNGLPNRGYPEGTEPQPFSYLHTVPRVMSATNLSFFAHVDGSAANVMFKLGGGIPLNDVQHHGGDERDHPPGWDTTDVYLGYEQADFHSRIWPEKFGSTDANYNVIGSAGAETYEFVVGESDFTFWAPDEPRNDWNATYGPLFVYHDPRNQTDDGMDQLWPAPEDAAGQSIWFQTKVGNQGDANRVYVYYTTDGSWPDGAAGRGIGTTKVIELFFRTNVVESGGNVQTWQDDADQYSGGWTNDANGGSGFGAWNLYDTSDTSGHFVWTSTEHGHADINTGDKSFGMFAYSNEWSNSQRGISEWGDGYTFSIDLATQWRDGGRGITLFNSNSTFDGTTEIWNFNISDAGYGSTAFPYYGDMVLRFEVTQNGDDLDILVTGSSAGGAWSDTWSTTLTGETLGGFRLYTGGHGGDDAGERNLYFNRLLISAPIGDGGGVVNDWWSEGSIPAQPAGTRIKYKVSAVRQQGVDGAGWEAPFPGSWDNIERKKKMMGTWKIENFNPSTVVYYPHNDYGVQRTGLVEGFNMIAARVFLQRDGAEEGNGQRAAIYNTFYQPFYYDAAPPAGEVVYPQAGETLYDNSYGVVVRTDPTVQRVWYNIVDADNTNDDATTGANHGNGLNSNGVSSWIEAQRINPDISIDSDYPLQWRFNYVNIPSSGAVTIQVKLGEYSSSTNPLLSDAEGRFTTLERTLTASGPEYRMNVAWPQNDGDTVGQGYEMKVHFSENLAHWDEAVTRSRFLISINGQPQDRDAMTFNYDIGGGNYELVYALPDLYNGDPNYEHEIVVTHQNAAGQGITLTAERRVRVPEGAGRPPVLIIDPPEFNLDGARYQIVLPDLADPDPADRRHPISIQTEEDAQTVWITFENSTGTVAPVPSGTNILTGTLAVSNGVTFVRGDAESLFFDELSAGSVVEIDATRMVVAGVQSNDYFTLTQPWTGASASGLAGRRITGNPTAVGNSLFWEFDWSDLQAGSYTIVAHADFGGETGVLSNRRTTEVLLRQVVERDDTGDSDNDGIPDSMETTATPLPETNPETWSNGDVHVWHFTGRTDPTLPITDGGGLPDGLQLGLSNPISEGSTDRTADTNGDGWLNFMPDRDPPIFNTTDNWEHPRYNFNASRTDQLGGSMTDPNRADTDGDGLPDHVEDLNRNGRVDVGLLDGSGVVTDVLRNWFEDRNNYLPMVYNTSRVDRDGLPTNARFLETDPNSNDTIGDGMSDGAADVNANGRVDMMLLYANGTTEPFDISEPANHQYLIGMDAASQSALAAAGESNIMSRAINYDKLFEDFGRPVIGGDGNWYETNKWPRILFLEVDPLVRDTNQDGLDDGWKVRYGLDPFDDGWYNLRTGEMYTQNSQQGADGDITGDGILNSQHQSAGTDPRVNVNIPVPSGSITIGPGAVVGQVDGADIYEEFMDWTWDDLRALDYYHGGGPNSKQGDVYRGWDGYDTSRDMVAFYTRDGGAAGAGGDDKFYFRVDLYDLQAFAENEHVNIYVVIDTGNPNAGERVLPDQVDTRTDMRWELVVAVYDSATGRVFVDENPAQNTSVFTEDLFSFGGVVERPDYFLGAYFNSELDAVEFAIDRQALLDVNYIGDPSVLNYQVFTTKPGTENVPQGAGDIGGRSDVRDSILNDYIAEDDHWAQAGLQGLGSVLREWIRGDARPNRAKISKIVHANQAIQRGSTIQDLINNDAGAGYYRVLDAHQGFGVPLNLHITPTLASAIQWAVADPAAGKPWRDGPALNARIADMAAQGQVALMASTFSDHMLPYFTPEFIADNVALATEFLETIYGVDITANSVFWTPERLLDHDVFGKINQLGFRATVIDQMEHLFHWYGRQAALGTRGYQINRISGVDTFAINNGANDFRFANHDGGLSMPLRRLLNRQARSDWDQVVVLMSHWEDFTSVEVADAYDRNVRWLANRPWIHGVTLESILREEVDLDGDGQGQAWYVEDRGALGAGVTKLSHNYVNYLTRRDYDNWYLGSDLEEGLSDRHFAGQPYGMVYSSGIVKDAWDTVAGMSDEGAGRLARSVLHASVFQTAFHSGELGNMAKFSNGEYINPDGAEKDVADFAAVAQAQTRKAALYERVDQWLATANSLVAAQTEQADVDLDGTNEYLLYNRHVFALFEQMGGRLIAVWVRDPASGAVYQMIGNLASWAGSETEEEGVSNEDAYRTSALKDWWADGASQSYVNTAYNFSAVAGGWTATSADGQISKTVTLGDDNRWLTMNYQVDPSRGTLYVRNGLSPDLYGLMLHGQQYLTSEQHAGGTMTLAHAHPDRVVSVYVAYGDMHTAQFNETAQDGAGLDTRRMRNQAQTHQVELSGSGSFSFALGFDISGEGEQYNDGVPYSWLNGHGYDAETVNVTTTMAANGVHTLQQAYWANLDPADANAFFGVTQAQRQANSIVVRFATRPEREYLVWYADNGLMMPTWQQGPTDRIQGTGGIVDWEDDGTETDPHPLDSDGRVYKIEVMVP
jgi:hypothetical protein